MVPFDRSGMSSYSSSTATMAIIVYRLRDKARYWSKVASFSYTLLHNKPSWEKQLQKCSRCLLLQPRPWHTMWCKQILEGVLCLCAIHTRYRHRQTDRQTDGRKSDLNSGAFYHVTQRLRSGEISDHFQWRRI